MDGRGYIFSLDGERERMQLTMWKPLTGLSAAPTHIQWNDRGTWIKYLTRDYDIAHYTLYHSFKRYITGKCVFVDKCLNKLFFKETSFHLWARPKGHRFEIEFKFEKVKYLNLLATRPSHSLRCETRA